MKKLITLFLCFSAVFICGAQNIVYDNNAEARPVEKFTAIEVSGTVAVYLSQGSEQGVAVSAGDRKYNGKIKTEVKNGVLSISVDGGMWNGFNWTNKKLKAYVTVTDISRIELSGASFISISGAIKTADLKLQVSGASEIKGNVNVSRLNMEVSGASIVRLSGTVNEALVEASGACKISGYGLSVDNCKAESSGASDIRMTVNKQLKAEASSGSTIYYKGAAVATVNASAGASIQNRSGNDD